MVPHFISLTNAVTVPDLAVSALKAPSKIASDNTLFSFCFCFHRKQGLMFHVNPLLSMQRIHMKYKILLKKIRLDVSCESSVNPHMKYQVLFSLQNNEKVFKTAMLGRGVT